MKNIVKTTTIVLLSFMSVACDSDKSSENEANAIVAETPVAVETTTVTTDAAGNIETITISADGKTTERTLVSADGEHRMNSTTTIE